MISVLRFHFLWSSWGQDVWATCGYLRYMQSKILLEPMNITASWELSSPPPLLRRWQACSDFNLFDGGEDQMFESPLATWGICIQKFSRWTDQYTICYLGAAPPPSWFKKKEDSWNSKIRLYDGMQDLNAVHDGNQSQLFSSENFLDLPFPDSYLQLFLGSNRILKSK